jgi:hypothetical protein
VTLTSITIRAGDDVLEDAAVLLDGLDRSDVVIVTGNEDAFHAKPLACNLERLPDRFRGTSVLVAENVDDVPAVWHVAARTETAALKLPAQRTSAERN